MKTNKCGLWPITVLVIAFVTIYYHQKAEFFKTQLKSKNIIIEDLVDENLRLKDSLNHEIRIQ